MAGPRAVSVWAEVINRRRQLHIQAGDASCELWQPADPAWTGLLFDTHGDVQQARADVTGDHDPREALIDLLAVGSAWVDAFDSRRPVVD